MPNQQQTASDIATLVSRLQLSVNALSTAVIDTFASDVDMKGHNLNNVGAITVGTVNYNSLNPPASGNHVSNYSTFASVAAPANFGPANLADTPSAIGSLTFEPTLVPGSVIVFNLLMTARCGGADVFAPVLTTAAGDLLAASIPISGLPDTPLTLKYTVAIRDTTAVVSSIAHLGSAMTQTMAEVAFDRSVAHTFAIMSGWSDSEAGGNASAKSITVETYFPRGP